MIGAAILSGALGWLISFAAIEALKQRRWLWFFGLVGLVIIVGVMVGIIATIFDWS